MAQPHEPDGGIARSMFNAGAYVAATATLIWDKLTADGHLAAAARQGADEIGQALKAFPDAIQTQETGTLWNPTQAEVTNSRRDSHHSQSEYGNALASVQPGTTHYRSPSDLAASLENQAVQDTSLEQEHGHEM